MQELQKVFNYAGKNVRVIIKDNEPWWVAKDVCEILGIDSSQTRRIDDDEKGLCLIQTLGGEQNMLCVNEPGLYSLILGSRKEEAKQFKRWITHEVIPSIRKHGAYMTPDTIEKVLNDPDTIIQLATRLKDERQKRLEAEQKLEEQKPLVLFAETCVASNDSLLVREVAKLATKRGINIGEKRLWKKLREWGIVNKHNEPYQKAFDAGWFETKQGTYATPYGTETYRTYKVTPKGQIYIIERLKKEFESISV